jgi:hypothetical protein
MACFIGNTGYKTGVSMEFWTSKRVNQDKFTKALEKAFSNLEIEIDMDYYDVEKMK